MRTLFLIAGIILAFAAEILHVYFILPFPFSQKIYAPGLAYFFYRNITWLRIISLALVIYPAIYIFLHSKKIKKLLLFGCVVLYAAMVFYGGNYLKASEKYPPLPQKTFATNDSNKIVFNKQVIGVAINGEAKAYPVQVLAYHHFITDSIGRAPVVITYCSICRSARVFSSVINGRAARFELVGVNRFNALLEDDITKSWWQQETGKAIAGPMKGKNLKAITFGQHSLSSWLRQYPGSKILQPGQLYMHMYALMGKYEKSPFAGNAFQVSTPSYAARSLVVGVIHKNEARCYDWNKLNYVKLVQDSLGGTPLLLTVEPDNISFHAWKRKVKNKVLRFEKTNEPGKIKDVNTSSVWNMEGQCIEGELMGTRLKEIQSYQETRASWDDFHKESEEYNIAY